MDHTEIRFPQESHAGGKESLKLDSSQRRNLGWLYQTSPRADGKRDLDGSVTDKTTPRPAHTSPAPFKPELQSISSFTIEKFFNRHLGSGG